MINLGEPIKLECTSGAQLNWPQLLDAKRATLIVLVSCHCPYALQYYKPLDEIYKEVSAANIAMILVNSNNSSDEDEPETIAYMKEKFSWLSPPFCRDEGAHLARVLGASVTPEAFLLLPTGELIWSGAIDNRYLSPEDWSEGLEGRWPWDEVVKEASVNHLGAAIEAYINSEPIPKGDVAIGCAISTN